LLLGVADIKRHKPIPRREDAYRTTRHHGDLVYPRGHTMKFRIRRNLKRTLLGVFGASILAGGLTACMGHREHGFGGPMTEERSAEFRGKMIEKVGQKLELNDAQKQLLSVLGDKLQEQRKALVAGGDPRADMLDLVNGAKFNRDRAQALVEEKTTALRSKSPEVIAAAADFYDALNATQQQKVRDFMQRRGGWFHRG
jgi:protein CpxP